MARRNKWRWVTRATVLAGLVGAAVSTSPGAAVANSPANANANCVGIVLSVEAPSSPQFIGSQVRELAPHGALPSVINELAHVHGGSYEACEG